jgi:hypothetical protein
MSSVKGARFVGNSKQTNYCAFYETTPLTSIKIRYRGIRNKIIGTGGCRSFGPAVEVPRDDAEPLV